MAGRDIVTNLIANDKASKPLKDAAKAAESAADSFDDLSAAEVRLALEAEKAAVRVDKATRSLTNAQERYGKESSQARLAALRLRAAQLDLADASQKAQRELDEAGDVAERTGRRFDGLRDKLGGLGSIMRHVSGLSLLAAGTSKLGGFVGAILPGLASAAAGMGAFGTAALTAAPAVIGVGVHVAAATAGFVHFAAAAAPAAASLLPLAAGLALIKGTLIAAGPAFTTSLSPITKAFTDVQKPVGELATKHLPSLAREFVRVNFPAIRSGMEYIAQSVNGIVVSVGRWINSTTGQQAIAKTVDNISEAFAQLAPDVSKLAIAFLNLFGRTAGDTRAVDLLATGLQRAMGFATRFLDSLTPDKIDAAWQKLEGFAGGVGRFAGKMQALGGLLMTGIRWWQANADAIQHVRDVLGVITIAVGVATGGWIPALVAGVSLLIAHWDRVSAALQSAKRWLAGTSDEATAARTVISAFQGAVADLSSWFTSKLLPALERAGRAVLPALKDAIGLVSRTFNENRAMIDKSKAIFTALGIVITEAIIPAVSLLAQVYLKYLSAEFSALIVLINRVVLPGFRIFTRIVLDQFGAIINGAAEMLGWVPGIGPQLRDAAKKFNTFRDQVNGALSGIKDQKVTVSAAISYSTGKGTASGGTKVGMMARGGPVSGPGGPREDRIPAMLSNGEFVVNARDTARHRPLLERINAGRYANGGLVVDPQTSGLAATMAAQRRGLAAAAQRLMPSLLAGLTGGGSTAGARSIGKAMAAAFGWTGGQWAALERLWTGESGWNPRAKNPTSTAFGIPQFLKSTAAAYGLAYGDTNASHQIAAGLRYIRSAYGNPAHALSMWSSRHPHWYANGGVINEPVMGIGLRSGDRYGFGERGPETVIPGRPQSVAGGTTVRYETTVNINATGSDIELENKLVRVLTSANQRGRLRPLGIS